MQRQLAEARKKIELLEREKREILSALESMNQSVGWRLVKRYRKLKNRFLPPGTLRRRLYDRGLMKLRNPSPPASIQQTESFRNQSRVADLSVPPDYFYQAQLALLNAPMAFEPGKMERARVSVTNQSPCRWEATANEPDGRGSVRLSYRWYDGAGKVIAGDGERTTLPRDLEPQESLSVDMRVFAPFEPGTYTLEIALVQEGIAWFTEKGGAGIRSSVRVVPAGTHPPEFPSCSIVIPAFNRAEFTKTCLLAIEKSAPPERISYEVLVVDDGSTDETPALLSSWSSSRANARFVRRNQNLGFARACNEGARLARGRYLVLLNNDTLPTPQWLENMLALALREPRVGIVGSKLLFPNGRIQHVGVVFDKNKNPRHIYRGFPPDILPATMSREYQAVTGACLLIDRQLYWSVGGMDEDYQNSFEETDLCLKIRARGFRVLTCADSVLYHFEGLSEGRHTADFHNAALFKARWEDAIAPDEDLWYARDNLKAGATEYEPEGGDYPLDANLLESLWRQVYSCSLPDSGLRTGTREAETHGD